MTCSILSAWADLSIHNAIDGSSAKGIVYDDKVTVGNLTLDTQAVQAATKVSDQFVRDKSFGGILGLAFNSINSVVPKQQKTWFENIKDSLDSAVWTVNLRHSARKSDRRMLYIHHLQQPN